MGMGVQGTGGRCGGGGRAPRACGGETKQQAVWKAEAMLLQRSVESLLFQGRKLAGETNADKVERFARELDKEHARRKQNPQLMSPGGGGPPIVVASAAAPNNDKQPADDKGDRVGHQPHRRTAGGGGPTAVADVGCGIRGG